MAKRKAVCVHAQPCPPLRDSHDCSLTGSSVHGIFQARILEWVAISFSRDLPNPRIEPTSPALAGWQSDLWIFTGCYESLFGTTKHPN